MGSGTGSDVDPVREVNRLHLVLDDWYGGIRDHIEPIELALAEDFTWISPDGRLAGPAESLEAWRERREERLDGPTGVDVEDVTVQRTIYGVHQMTFTKHVTAAGTADSYTCTLWLRETERVPSGLQWLHLSETRIERPASETN